MLPLAFAVGARVVRFLMRQEFGDALDRQVREIMNLVFADRLLGGRVPSAGLGEGEEAGAYYVGGLLRLEVWGVICAALVVLVF